MYVVLMAGGVGTRFWPLSRRSAPKQLLAITGEQSMIQLTYDRIKSLTSPDKIFVVTQKDQKRQILDHLPEVPEKNIIAEPFGKNTAPCIGLASIIIKKRYDAKEAMVVLPADHLIEDLDNFSATIRAGAKYVTDHCCLVTIGIKPTYAETGYGYIQTSNKISEKDGIAFYRVKTFAEKPNLETAERFLRSGDFLWNSGMFIWPVDKILEEIDEYLPELGADLNRLTQYVDKSSFDNRVEEVYSRTKSISIDYGIMEVARDVCVIKADFIWNDLGSWEAVYNISEKDINGNVIIGKEKVMINAQQNFVFSKKKLVAAVDVHDLVIIEMDDAILVCKKDKSQDVKSVVEYLERKQLDKYL